MKHILITALFVFSLLGTAGAATGGDMKDHQMGHGGGALSEASQAYTKAMDAMHGPMMEGVKDPDPDAAFVRGMIPHHKGAVDMARIELQYGKDPELRKLAEEIIKAQETEIRFMEEWLQKRAPKR